MLVARVVVNDTATVVVLEKSSVDIRFSILRAIMVTFPSTSNVLLLVVTLDALHGGLTIETVVPSRAEPTVSGLLLASAVDSAVNNVVNIIFDLEGGTSLAPRVLIPHVPLDTIP
jgi:hypothetical protein|tara:strand:+ start:683 stop:1027 length:345 start_codon:yes stop_codon:yes gene_type:complete